MCYFLTSDQGRLLKSLDLGWCDEFPHKNSCSALLCVCLCTRSACVKRQADMLTDSKKRIFCLLLGERLILHQCPRLSVSPSVCLPLWSISALQSQSPSSSTELRETSRPVTASSLWTKIRWVMEFPSCRSFLHLISFAPLKIKQLPCAFHSPSVNSWMLLEAFTKNRVRVRV